MMTRIRLTAGRQSLGRSALAALFLLLTSAVAVPADLFPFDRELVLDVPPMRPVKRVPILTVAPDGNATIDLWCKSAAARVEIADSAVKIEAGPLPEALPQYMSEGQCTPERQQADADLLAVLTQVTAWRKQGSKIVLAGPVTLTFRPSDH